MRAAGHDVERAGLFECTGGVGDRARRVHNVVDEQYVAPGHIADDVHDLRFVLRRPPLVDDGEVGAEAFGVAASRLDGAHVGGDNHEVVLQPDGAQVLDEQAGGVEVIDRHVEEALDLRRVQVHRKHPVDACCGEQVGHQLGSDGHAGLVFALLAGVAEIRHHRRNARGRGAAGGVDEQQQLQPVVGRGAGGLDEVQVGPADGLVVVDVQLAVREVLDFDLAEAAAEGFGDAFGEAGVRSPGEKGDGRFRARIVRRRHSDEAD